MEGKRGEGKRMRLGQREEGMEEIEETKEERGARRNEKRRRRGRGQREKGERGVPPDSALGFASEKTPSPNLAFISI